MAQLTAMQAARIERDRAIILKRIEAERKKKIGETVARWADKKLVK